MKHKSDDTGMAEQRQEHGAPTVVDVLECAGQNVHGDWLYPMALLSGHSGLLSTWTCVPLRNILGKCTNQCLRAQLPHPPPARYLRSQLDTNNSYLVSLAVQITSMCTHWVRRHCNHVR